MPQRRSTSVKVTKRLAHLRRTSGKSSFTSRSRSRIMSRKVEEIKTRMTRSFLERPCDSDLFPAGMVVVTPVALATSLKGQVECKRHHCSAGSQQRWHPAWRIHLESGRARIE